MILMVHILSKARVTAVDSTRAGRTRDSGLHGAKEAGARVAESREHQDVRLELTEAPLHDHLGDGGQLQAVAGVLVQRVLTSRHQTQLGHQTTQGSVLGTVALYTRDGAGNKYTLIVAINVR